MIIKGVPGDETTGDETTGDGTAAEPATAVSAKVTISPTSRKPAAAGRTASDGLSAEIQARAKELIALYPHPRSALIPICHLAQEQHGWLTPHAIEAVAALVGVTPAEVKGTASFYDMLHTEPVGKYVMAICTNIACMLRGAYELLEHAEQSLGIKAGGTTIDGDFTLEDAECLADCGRAPCLQVNHRFFGDVTAADFDKLVGDLRSGALADTVPLHGTLVRVRRDGGLRVGSEPAEATSPKKSSPKAKGS
jgi:NADH-quinone oxidoreductase E subunit